jgi:hypothetical protein
VHFVTRILPVLHHQKDFELLMVLPWIMASLGLIAWSLAAEKADTRYKTFLRNSPGITVDTSGVVHGPGHPV